MKLTLSCPSCDVPIVISIENDSIKSVKIAGTTESSQEAIEEILKQHNIELG